MNDPKWDAVIERVEVRMPFPVRFVARRDARSQQVLLRCTISVRDVHSGKPLDVHTADTLESEYADGWGDAERIAALQRLLLRAVRHELDECFLVDGRQLRDPHIAIGARCPAHDACVIEMVDRATGEWSCTNERAS